MLKLTIYADKAPEFEADVEKFEEIEDFSKSYGQVVTEIISNITKDGEEYTMENKRNAVVNLLKNSEQIAYFRMKQLWRVEDISLEELMRGIIAVNKTVKPKKSKKDK